ncbi:MAG: gliding motility-associated C-terminal domain-containing protein [Chitinophagales bacterium]
MRPNFELKNACKLICIFYAFFSLPNVSAQNLVPNYSFEDYSSLPTGYGDWWKCENWDNVNGFVGWMWPYASPDYLHDDGGFGVDLPSTSFGTLTAHEGDAVMGWASSVAEFREYISAQFISPMIIGATYNVSFYITNGEDDWLAYCGIDRVGLTFSTGALTQLDHEPIGGIPQYEIPGVFWTDSWELISFTFVADAAYDRITIGNFYDDAATDYVDFVGGGSDVAYYFIDEVVVMPAVYTTIIDTSICTGEIYLLPDGATTDSAGSYVDSLVSITGLDSVIYTNLEIAPVYSILIEDVLCNGEIYLLPDGSNAATSGIYNFNLISSFGCDSLISIELQFLPELLSSQEIVLCSDQNYILPDGIIVSDAGIYISTVASVAGCDSTITTTINVEDPVVVFIDTIFTYGGAYTLPDGTVVIDAGSYTVILNTVAGCDSTIIINLDFTTEFIVPNAFSPNNDGLNDIFHVVENGAQLIQFEIYDRWGQLIYSTITSPVEWDGNVNGHPQEVGVYVYSAVYLSAGDAKKKSGNITLLR